MCGWLLSFNTFLLRNFGNEFLFLEKNTMFFSLRVFTQKHIFILLTSNESLRSNFKDSKKLSKNVVIHREKSNNFVFEVFSEYRHTVFL